MTNYNRPLNLWEYLDAGGVLTDVLPKRHRLLIDAITSRADASRHEREMNAAQTRAFSDDLIANGAHGAFAVPMTDGTVLADDDVQELAWMWAFESDIWMTDDESQVERVAALMPADAMAEARTVMAELRRYAPIDVGVPVGHTTGDPCGWCCNNCGEIREPGEAEALIVKPVDGTSLYLYCGACVGMAATALEVFARK